MSEYGMTKPPLGSQIDWGHPLSKGIVGCWLFNEGQGDKANDISGNKNHGTLTNVSHPATTTSGWNPGKFGKAIRLDGINDYVNIASKSIRQIIKQGMPVFKCSISALITPHDITPRSVIIGDWNLSGSNESFKMEYTSGVVQIGLRSHADINSISSVLTNNKTTLITATYDGNRLALYVNGNLKNSSNVGTILDDGSSTSFGRAGAYPGLYYNGQIGTVIFHNRSLTPQEVQQLYTSPFCFIK